MVWTITKLNNETGQNVSMSDGEPVEGHTRQSTGGVSTRMFVMKIGIVDIVDLGKELLFNDLQHFFQDAAHLIVTLEKDTFHVKNSKKGTVQSGTYLPFPKPVSESDIGLFKKQMDINLIPYQDIPPNPKPQSIDDIKEIAPRFFPYSKNPEDIAIALWDWTTANFTRIVYFRMFAYTKLKENSPLDDESITTAIWESDWGPYTPRNKDYMNSFLMKPADTLQSVKTQYAQVKEELYLYANAELNLIDAALRGMPRTSVQAIPVLFSGQMDIAQLKRDRLAAHYAELPENAGPIGTPLKMRLSDAQNGFMKIGNVITVKGIMSFTDSLDDALSYGHGIIIKVVPKETSTYWENAKYVTPMSSKLTRQEYLFYPNSKFLVKNWRQVDKSKTGKAYTEIFVQEA